MNIYFGENLKKLRKSKNLTQDALADFLGMSFQAVSKWERGETYPDILIHTSNAIKGLEFDKTRAYRFGEGSFLEDMKEGLINRPELSEEFKNSKGFRRLLKIV